MVPVDAADADPQRAGPTVVRPALGAEPVQHPRPADHPGENHPVETHLDDSGPSETGHNDVQPNDAQPDGAELDDTQSDDTEPNVAESDDTELDDTELDHPHSGGVQGLRRGPGSRQGAPVPR